jgi:hypothetical protein
MAICDFEGKELSIGDEVVFISSPHMLNRGMVTGFKQLNTKLTVVQLVVGQATITVAPFLCAKLAASGS